MKRFLIFVCVLFAIGTAYGDDIVCPDGYPYSDAGATSVNECYSDVKIREWDGKVKCRTMPDGCTTAACTACEKEPEPCEYVEYSNGEIKSGCASNPCLSDVVLRGYNKMSNAEYNPESGKCEPCAPGTRFGMKGMYYGCIQCNAGTYQSEYGQTSCKLCPINTYSTYDKSSQCTPCPNGAFTIRIGATKRAECMRTLNYRASNSDIPTQIYLSGYKVTSPALAVGIGDDVFYANMMPVDNPMPNKMHIGYNNKIYMVSGIINAYSDSAFLITTTPDTDSFNLYINASGNFTVDWGDGDIETVKYETCARNQISHKYDAPGKYTISLSGRATGYCKIKKGMTYVYYSIEFTDKLKISGIDGSLGAVFPTLDDGTNPNFNGLFSGATNLTGQIPSMLFSGITGSPAATLNGKNMFRSVFSGCSGLTGQIPVGLFGYLSGEPGEYTFMNAFNGCSGLTGPAARNFDGTPLYDIEYNGKTWYEQSPSAFTNMYTGSGIDTNH